MGSFKKILICVCIIQRNNMEGLKADIGIAADCGLEESILLVYCSSNVEHTKFHNLLLEKCRPIEHKHMSTLRLKMWEEGECMM